MRNSPSARAFYIATKCADRRWALEISSTIFTPLSHIGAEYPDPLRAVVRHSDDWNEGWSASESDLLNSTRGLRGRSVSLVPSFPIVGADLPYPSEAMKSEGVASRLHVTDTDEVRPVPYDGTTFEWFRTKCACHGVGDYAYTLTRPDVKVLHHARNNSCTTRGTRCTSRVATSVTTRMTGRSR